MRILFICISFLAFLSHSYSAETRTSPLKFELIENRIFVDVFINDQGPFKFIFDTGGNNSMTFALARQLGLPVKDIGDGAGAGNGSQPMGETQVQKLQIGEVAQSSQDFLVIDYSKIQHAFNLKALDGIFGHEVLQQYLTLIDYENSQISFFSKDSDFIKTGYEILSFDLLYDKPFIKSSVNGLKANTLIDTGDRSALTVTKQFLKNKSIAKSFKGKPILTSGYGIGGPIPAQISTVKSLVIGKSSAFKEVASRAPTSDGGFNAIKGLDASLGNEVLKQFNLAFDYKNKIIYFKKNKNFGERTTFTPVPNP